MKLDSDMSDRQSPPERDLNHAGSVVDKAIEFMTGQNISELAIASALLGGAVGLLARNLPDDVVVQVLQNAIESVEAGEMRRAAGKDHAGEA
jgi:hypothetical protein